MPSVASASGSATITFSNVIDQGGLPYSLSKPAAGFFDVTATNGGGSHLTHEDLRVYIPASFTPLAAFSMNDDGLQTSYPGCNIQNRGGDVTLPAFLCSWDDNWEVGQGRGPITFAVGGSTAGTFTGGNALGGIYDGNGIYATLSPAAQPPIGFKSASITVTTVGSGDRATYYTGRTGSLTGGTTEGPGSQSTTFVLPKTDTGYVVDLKETMPSETETGIFTCDGTTPSGQIGQLITSHINGGASVAPYIKWTVVIVVPGSPKYDTTNLAIYHCTDLNHLDVITQGEVCGAPSATDGCMISVNSKFVTKGGSPSTIVTVVFETLTNGFLKGGAS
jgi:hypothetical protein